ncbi:hypothetical protein PAXINDRAFT_15831 [Paxillus involutus ATCC 200175]|uniref:Uncharacterized protein n=1 Tax=Paxillus involutus ATCC 200175 TaxID=664439 RepID=A0A0C9T6F6_PAXIN|nr:hypothetical protein PAXINDRAFT_15831 [Paxillus involutus ATCC 200175]
MKDNEGKMQAPVGEGGILICTTASSDETVPAAVTLGTEPDAHQFATQLASNWNLGKVTHKEWIVTIATTYVQTQYLEPLSNTSSNYLAIASCDAVLVDHGFTQASDYGQYPSLHVGVEGYSMYSHQGYEDGHLIQEQIYRLPRSECHQHYQPDGPSIPAHGYAIGQGSGPANAISPTTMGISESLNGTSDVTGVPAPQVALACSGPGSLQTSGDVELSSHEWYVDEDQHAGNIINVLRLSAPTSLSPSERSGPQEPVDCATPWARGDTLQLNAMDAGPQLLPAMTTSQGSHGSGLLQPDLLGSRPAGQGVHRGPVGLTPRTTQGILPRQTPPDAGGVPQMGPYAEGASPGALSPGISSSMGSQI